MRLLTYNYFINKYIFNNQICRYNNYLPNKPKSFTFNTTDDVNNFIKYYHVKNHDFGDLNLADEITINDGIYNKTWLIAGFNTQLDSNVKNGSFGKHHLTLIPKDYLLANVSMHNQSYNSKGFAGTNMFTNTLFDVNNNLSNILDNHLLLHKVKLTIDKRFNTKMFEAKSMLLNYNQVFGIDVPYRCFLGDKYTTSARTYLKSDIDKYDIFQMPLFKQDVKYKSIGKYWWLRTMFSTTTFRIVTPSGRLYDYFIFYHHLDHTIRPYICLG